jgi:hypothetical protein
MRRREFLHASLPISAATCLATGIPATLVAAQTAGANPGKGRQLYEWRTYRLDDKAKQSRVHEYLKSAALPAWKRTGVGPVGVFTEIGAEARASIHVLLVYPTAATLAAKRDSLEQDPEYNKAAAEYLAAKKENPAFDRIESSLMIAFTGAPQITLPAPKPRVLEVRTYESFSEDRARAKVDMFNDGEIAIFPQCGFENVFFGETLIGAALPNLKYMLAAPDMKANEAGWKVFLEHPEFVKMKNDPKYADTVSKITKLFLEPTDYSQI